MDTSNRAAQQEFDRGLTLVYAFDYDRAIEAFDRAAELDPEASMPHWGVALALGPSINDLRMNGRMSSAHRAAQRAVESAGDESDRQRDYTRALAARYTGATTPNLGQLYRSYTAAMRELTAKYPDDPDAATLFAESLMLSGSGAMWQENGAPGDGTAEAIRALESALGLDPNHIGANHHYIHLLEDSPDPERALAAARRLDAINLRHGHLLHMPSHIYVRIGDYRAAVASNVRAVAADAGHTAHHAAVGGYPSLMAHSRGFLAAAASMTGQLALARRTVTNLFLLLRFQKWDEILRYSPREDPVARLEWQVARVLALAATGRLKEAEVAFYEYEEAERTLPSNALWWTDPIPTFLPLARSEMAARMAWARGDRQGALAHWRQAVEAQDQLTRGEITPWPWYHPTRESLGAALYLSGYFNEAERVFRHDLRVNRGNPRSLFGLLMTLDAQGRKAEAAQVKRRFDVAWADADARLSMSDLL